MKNTISTPQAQSLLEKIRNDLSGTPWQEILETCAITGVADMEQLRAVSAYERMKLRRLLEKMETLHGEYPPILTRARQKIQRTGKKGGVPVVFLLGESGAALLHLLGHPNAHECGLADETAIAHALAMVDVHLAAQRAGVQVVTDRTISYDKGSQVLRPDHQVSLPGRKILLFEIEQAASTETLRRVLASISRKRAFFENHESGRFERSVQILLQVPNKTTWEKTLATWARAAQMNAQETGKPLNFNLRVMSLADFLQHPDWQASDEQRWTDLAEAQQTAALVTTKTPPPAELIRRSAREDHLVMAALWQDFIENADKQLGAHPRPAPEFLHTMRLIYAASHDPHLPSLAQAALPYASLYLLSQYLRLRGIDKVMHVALNKGRQTLRWNPTTIQHRMQTVIDKFLALHGWRSSGPLNVYASTADWNSSSSHTFQVIVQIRDPQILLSPGDMLLPGRDEIIKTEQALTWVLLALFTYSQELNLGNPEFW
jgi:hypothetical protein